MISLKEEVREQKTDYCNLNNNQGYSTLENNIETLIKGNRNEINCHTEKIVIPSLNTT